MQSFLYDIIFLAYSMVIFQSCHMHINILILVFILMENNKKKTTKKKTHTICGRRNFCFTDFDFRCLFFSLLVWEGRMALSVVLLFSSVIVTWCLAFGTWHWSLTFITHHIIIIIYLVYNGIYLLVIWNHK